MDIYKTSYIFSAKYETLKNSKNCKLIKLQVYIYDMKFRCKRKKLKKKFDSNFND